MYGWTTVRNIVYVVLPALPVFLSPLFSVIKFPMHPLCLRGETGGTLGWAKWCRFSAIMEASRPTCCLQRNGRKTVLWCAASRAPRVYLQGCMY